jgi:nucleolar protein 56
MAARAQVLPGLDSHGRVHSIALGASSRSLASLSSFGWCVAQMGVLFLLFESAAGYALFERVSAEEITPKAEDVLDLKKFSQIVKLKAYLPFESAETALENINAISEGDATKYLVDFLELNLPKGSTLGVSESKLGNVLSETAGMKVKSNETVLELLRGIRAHFTRFIKALKPGDAQQAMLGLGHSYSRSKVKFNVHRVDNMIIQSSALLDQLDKDLVSTETSACARDCREASATSACRYVSLLVYC